MSSVRIRYGFVLAVVFFFPTDTTIAQPPVWGLRPPDRFTVETTIDQTTTVTLEGSKPVTTSKTEKLRVEYRVQRNFPAETLFYVVVTAAESDASPSDLQKLKVLEQLSAGLAVDKAGIVRNIDGHRELLRRIGDVDSNVTKFLEYTYPQEVYSAWLGRPFWLATSTEPPEKGAAWERIDNLSLGMMGSFRTIAECQVSEIEDNMATVTISGKGRHVSPPPAGQPPSQSVAFHDIDVTMKSFSGSGKMWLPPTPEEESEDKRPPSEIRPGFESLTLQWEFEGSAKVKAGTKTVAVTFSESQKQTALLLPGYSIGTQRGLREYGLPLSIPKQ